MEQAAQDTVVTILSRETWTAQDHREFLTQSFKMPHASWKVRTLLSELEAANPEPTGAAALKIGILRYTLCSFDQALAALAVATDNKDRRYFQAMCYKSLRQYEKAAEEMDRAKDRGWDALEAQIELVEIQALGGRLDEAEKLLGKIAEKIKDRADGHYLRGVIDELRGFGSRAAEAYVQARAIDPGHSGATFRLAYYLDLHGEEDQAVELYKQCLSHPPVYASALVNLSVLYEDAGRYDKALNCLRHVLAGEPQSGRARLYARDVEASKTMFYDEEQAKRMARRNAVMDIPVTDFELSVRARNCLKKMNIRTLGDLVRTTEADLLAYKNFGETSLKEIKDMLTAKGLRLGQAQEEGIDGGMPRPPAPPAPVAPVAKAPNEGVLATPVEQVEFSIRSRRALQSLNIKTLGDLAGKTEADLLGCKNFGQTSLNEIRQRLSEYGLRLQE